MNKPIVAFLFIFLLAACNQGAEESRVGGVETKAPLYYYFPKANVYIDSANSDYIFLGNDGKSWQTAKQIPAAMQALMDKNVFIECPSQPVSQDNESHRLVYSALLYATPNDTTKKEAPKPTVMGPKTETDTVEKAEKERKGLGKFIDKIFGRKKNKNKDEEKDQNE
jgi:hypothetical protein